MDTSIFFKNSTSQRKMRKKKKKRKKKTTGKNNAHVHYAHGHFGQLKLSFSPTSFLLILGARGENTQAPPLFFPLPSQPNNCLKCSLHFSLLNFPSSLKSLHYSILPSKLNFLIGDFITWGCSSNCHNLGMQ